MRSSPVPRLSRNLGVAILAIVLVALTAAGAGAQTYPVFYPYRPAVPHGHRDIEFQWSDAYGTGGITPAVAKTLDNLARTMTEDYSNPFNAQMSDIELVFNYLFPFGDTYNRDPAAAVGIREPILNDYGWLLKNPRSADTTHVDIYIFPPGQNGLSGGSTPSQFLSLTEDTSTGHPADPDSVFSRNSVMFNGPDVAHAIDTLGTGWTMGDRGADAGSLHEFAHTFNEGIAGLEFTGPATNEVFSSAAEELIGQNDRPGSFEVPYTWPLLGLNRYKQNGCTDPWSPGTNYQNWRSFAAYVLYNFRGADTTATLAGFHDDLFFKWAHATPTTYASFGDTITNYNRTLEYLRSLLTDDSCATCASKGYFHSNGQPLPTIDRLALLHHNWRVANYVNNPWLAEGQYGFPAQFGFWPASNLNAWHSSDGCVHDDVVSVPPELTMSRTGAGRQRLASKFRSLSQNGGSSDTYQMYLNLTGAEYWILRSDASLASGGPYTLKVRVAADSSWRRRQVANLGQPDSVAEETELRLVASVIAYTNAAPTDSLWRHPEWATMAVAPQFVDLDSLERPLTLSVPNFGTTYKAALVVITAATGRGGELTFERPIDSWYETGGAQRYFPYRAGFAISDGVTLPAEPTAVASDGTAAESAPTWRPTNAELAYVRTPAGGPAQVYRNAISGGTPTAVYATSDDEHDPDWSPRGDAIVFVRGNTNSVSPVTDLWVAGLNGTATQVTTDGGWKATPVFNHNGRTIAYAAGFWYALPQTGQERRWGVWTVGEDGSARTQVVGSAFVNPITALRWSPDGAALWFTTTDSLYVTDLASGAVVNRTTVLPKGIPSFDLNRSGGPIAIEQPGSILWFYRQPNLRLAESFRRVALYDTTTIDADPLLYQRGNTFFAPRWSIDGTKVAYASGPSGGDLNVYAGTARTDHAPIFSTASYADADWLATCSLFTRTLSATDADGEAVTYRALYMPSGMSLSGNRLRWIPDTTQAGDWYVTLRALDGSGGMDQQVMKLTVQYAPDICSCPRYPYCLPASAQPVPATGLPSVFELSQNQPNPIRSTTAIRFALPTASHVRLEIFDLLGRHVRTLEDADLPAGFFFRTWDLRNGSGDRARPGIYMCRMIAGGFRAQRKMLLIP